jgi:hypothetical protein
MTGEYNMSKFIDIRKNDGSTTTVNVDYIIKIYDDECSTGRYTIIEMNSRRSDPTYWVTAAEGKRIRSLLPRQ